jgi:hypothetical protein
MDNFNIIIIFWWGFGRKGFCNGVAYLLFKNINQQATLRKIRSLFKDGLIKKDEAIRQPILISGLHD